MTPDDDAVDEAAIDQDDPFDNPFVCFDECAGEADERAHDDRPQ